MELFERKEKLKVNIEEEANELVYKDIEISGELLVLWDNLYNKLKTTTSEDNLVKIFSSINFMIIFRNQKKDYIKSNSRNLRLEDLYEEVYEHFYFNKISVNLYKNVLIDYNKNVSKGSLDQYILKFLETINDYNNICRKFSLYIASKVYTNTLNAMTASYNVMKLIRELLRNVDFKSIYDPSLATGNFISEVIEGHNVNMLSGQDISEVKVNITKMELILYGKGHLGNDMFVGNAILNPMNVCDGALKKYDCILSNPPFSGDWGNDIIKDWDEFNRFHRGIPPKNLPSSAFITHIVESLSEDGIGVVIVPNGVLFRGGSEKIIRESFVNEGIVDTIIYLPSNMMDGATIKSNIIIFNKAKRDKDIFIIDLTDYGISDSGKIVFSDEFINEVALLYEKRLVVSNISKIIAYEVLKENDFNLYNKRYIKTEVYEDADDFEEVLGEIFTLKEELLDLNRRLFQCVVDIK